MRFWSWRDGRLQPITFLAESMTRCSLPLSLAVDAAFQKAMLEWTQWWLRESAQSLEVHPLKFLVLWGSWCSAPTSTGHEMLGLLLVGLVSVRDEPNEGCVIHKPQQFDRLTTWVAAAAIFPHLKIHFTVVILEPYRLSCCEWPGLVDNSCTDVCFL